MVLHMTLNFSMKVSTSIKPFAVMYRQFGLTHTYASLHCTVDQYKDSIQMMFNRNMDPTGFQERRISKVPEIDCVTVEHA